MTQKEFEELRDKVVMMNDVEYRKFRQSEEYKAINSDNNLKPLIMDMIVERMGNVQKRKLILSKLYVRPELLENFRDMANYRTALIKTLAARENMTEDRNEYTIEKFKEADKEQRSVHNKALTSFNVFANSRCDDACIGEVYAGPLMDPSKFADRYDSGDSNTREQMTKAMIGILNLIQVTPRSEWDRLKAEMGYPVEKRIIEPIQDMVDGTDKLYNVKRQVKDNNIGKEIFKIQDSKHSRKGQVRKI